MKERNRLEAVLAGKCPQCHEGDLFTHRWWNITKFDEMHKHCPHCELRYEREPGFFYGAMYISYALTVGIMLVGGFVIYRFFGDPEPMGYIIPVVGFSIVFVPFNFRIARILFIHLFSGVRYKKTKKHE